jgi:hypothetical protein
MIDNLKFKSISRLSAYVAEILLKNKYIIDASFSNNHILIMVNTEDYSLKYEESIHDIDKIDDDVFSLKVNEICNNLEKFRT